MPTAIEPLITSLIAFTSGENASFRIYGTIYENVKIVDITSDNVTIQLENGDLEAYAPSDMELEYKQPDLSNLPPPPSSTTPNPLEKVLVYSLPFSKEYRVCNLEKNRLGVQARGWVGAVYTPDNDPAAPVNSPGGVVYIPSTVPSTGNTGVFPPSTASAPSQGVMPGGVVMNNGQMAGGPGSQVQPIAPVIWQNGQAYVPYYGPVLSPRPGDAIPWNMS